MTKRSKFDFNPLNSLGSIAMMVLGFIVLFYLVKGFFAIQPFLAIALFGVTALINYKVILGYVKWLGKLLRDNTVAGILGVVLTFIFPLIIALFLFGKAMLLRKANQMTKHYEGELVDYEEVEEEPPILIELPPLKKKQKRNEYEELFDDDQEIQ